MRAVINVTARGVLTLPVRFRRELGLTGDNLVIAESTREGVLLRPAVALPIEIYTDERVQEFNESEAELAAELSAQVSRPPTMAVTCTGTSCALLPSRRVC